MSQQRPTYVPAVQFTRAELRFIRGSLDRFRHYTDGVIGLKQARSVLAKLDAAFALSADPAPEARGEQETTSKGET